MAHGSVKLTTDFDEKFFGAQEVKDSFTSAIDNGAEISIVTEREPVDWYRENPKIEIRRVDKLPRHTMVIDNRYVRVERPHEPSTFGQDKGDVALILKGFSVIATKHSEEFNSLWTKLSSNHG